MSTEHPFRAKGNGFVRAAVIVAASFLGIASLRCAPSAGPGYPNVAVLYDQAGAIIREGKIGLTQASRLFYSLYPDAYDFLVFFTVGDFGVVEIEGRDLAYYLTVRNDVRGIGLSPTYDVGAHAGSAERLQGIVYMGDLRRFFDMRTGQIAPEFSLILGHEIGHRFVAYVRTDSAGAPSYMLLDRYRNHWTLAMDTDGSPMGGFDWREHGDGTFTAAARWTSSYCWLDLYLMGLARPEEVGPIVLLDLWPRPDSVALGTTLSAETCTTTVNEIIAVEGPRMPPYGVAPTVWRAAFALVVRDAHEATPEVVAGLETLRAAWPAQFAELTRGRGRMLTELAP